MPLIPDISETGKEYRERLAQWRKVRDVLEGEERIKERAEEYLPRPSGMKKGSRKYTSYLARASFYSVAGRTLSGLEGLVFRNTPNIDLPKEMEAVLEVATKRGLSLNMMLHDAIREVASMGRFGILVDLAAETSLEAVPHLSTYLAEDILRWEEEVIGGERKLTRLVLREESTTSGTTEIQRLVELFLDDEGVYAIQTWMEEEVDAGATSSTATPRSENQKDNGVTGSFERMGPPIRPMLRGRPLREIPFTFVGVKHLRARSEKPPFIDLANMNLAHYRNSADYEHSLFMVSQPTPFFFGVPDDEVPDGIGSGTIWTTPNEKAKAGLIEVTGAGLGNQSQAMDKKEQRMAILGALLISEDSSNVTAETTRMQARSQTSMLINTVDSVQAGVTQALRLAAVWMGIDPKEISIQFNRDFIETRLKAPEITAMVQSWQAGALSRQSLHENLQRGELIPNTRSLEDEMDLIEADQESGLNSFVDANTPEDTKAGAPTFEGGGSIEVRGGTAEANGHAHAFELTVEDDGTIGGVATSQSMDGGSLDHEHTILRLDVTEEADGHTHTLPIGGKK